MTAVHIPAPNRTTSVRTTRAYRCTSLSNSRTQFRASAGTPNRNERSTRARAASPCLHTTHPNSAARMPQLFRRFIGKTCIDGGVVKPHLLDNKNSCEYPRAGNEQTTGRQRGIPLKPRCQNRQKVPPLSAASGHVSFVPRDC